MNNPEGMQGFTLIELMVVVTVLGIIVAVGVPSFSTLIDNNRMSTMTNDLSSTLQYARSEAVRHRGAVQVSAIGGDVKDGLRVWIDVDGNGAFGSGDTELRVLEVDPAMITLAAELNSGALKNVAFSFNARGESSLVSPLILSLCDDRKGDYGRQLELLASGALRLIKSADCSGGSANA
ncbi:GspH/FimT family pseudopilin [Microbulbifer variabilis]|uniref:GspH/FimT family pseudopilin n=1 Tax=Microbulbifer variabilis TaxID=266805 RepID=UPI0003672E86|nr:GspH/FimT family pseudopilin [Microbulbifer variabilis]